LAIRRPPKFGARVERLACHVEPQLAARRPGAKDGPPPPWANGFDGAKKLARNWPAARPRASSAMRRSRAAAGHLETTTSRPPESWAQMEASAAFQTDRDREVAGQARARGPQLGRTASAAGPSRSSTASSAPAAERPGRGPHRSRHRRPSPLPTFAGPGRGSDPLPKPWPAPGFQYSISKGSSSPTGAKRPRASAAKQGSGPRPHRLSAAPPPQSAAAADPKPGPDREWRSSRGRNPAGCDLPEPLVLPRSMPA